MWVSGPARYLMRAAEYEEVRKLESVEDLTRFITEFWVRRDPTPGTFTNEYRRLFWDRVLEANRRYRDSTVPGWKTDRGKIFVLLGEPNYVESSEKPDNTLSDERRRAGPGLEDMGTRGIERWYYYRRFTKVAAPEYVVAFVRDESLDWRLSSNSLLMQSLFPGFGDDTPVFNGVMTATDRGPSGNRDTTERLSQLPSQRLGGGVAVGSSFDRPSNFATLPALDTPVFVNYDLGMEMSVVSNAELIIGTVSTREFLSGFIARSKLEFFRAQDGNTFVNLGALVPAQELYADRRTGTSTLRLYASLTDGSDASQVRYATNENAPDRFDLARGAPPGGLGAAWTGIALPPGRYITTIALEDSLTGQLGRLTQEILVPDFRAATLALSTLVPTSAVSESPATGRLGVTERASGVFRTSEDFGVYYEVYGLPKDDAAGFEASYTFFRETKEGPVQVGKPVVLANRTEGVQAWTIPLTRWPAGRFTLEVTVSVPGRLPVTSKLPFEVID
jgi:GWxTD domain-containing protein